MVHADGSPQAGEREADDREAQARLMLQAFGSVGVRAFAVTLTDAEGRKVPRGYQSFCLLDDLRAGMAASLRDTTRQRVNLIVRPHRAELVDLIQLDDLDAAALARVAASAFLTLQTSPGNFQAWVAVTEAPPDFARRLRKGVGADPTASGATRVAGSRNFKTKYAPDFPLVAVDRVRPGCITTAATLELAGLVAPAEAPPARVSRRVSAAGDRATVRRARKWPDYARCIQNAPPVHRGERADVSKADFTWCMTAIDWGWSIEATAARLLEQSSKAKENGEGYALLTAQNAAAAVERRRSQLKAPPVPR